MLICHSSRSLSFVRRIWSPFGLQCTRFSHTRNSSTTPSSDRPEPAEPKRDPQYELVYKFPYIVPVRVVSRLKIYQTAVTLAAVPFVHMAVQNGQIMPESATAATVAASMALATLYYISYITRRLVGLIAIDKSRCNVKVARMTFWGNHRDVTAPIDTIIPLSECRGSPTDIYTDLKTYDGNVNLYQIGRASYRERV